MPFPSNFILPISMMHEEDDDYNLTGELTITDTIVASSMFSRVSLVTTSSACDIGHTRGVSGKL